MRRSYTDTSATPGGTSCAPRRALARRRPAYVAAIGFVLTACGDLGTGTPGSSLSLSVVSGEHQRGRAGHVLHEPLAVLVTDAEGRGVGGVKTTWSVVSGEGALDARFAELECPPLSETIVVTDAGGFADVLFMPTWFGPSTVTVRVSGARGSPVTFTTDASDPGAKLTVASAARRDGKAGDASDPMWVLVTDAKGRAVANVSVTWSTPSLSGRLVDGCRSTRSPHGRSTTVRTLAGNQRILGEGGPGLAWMRFRPVEVGIETVSAALPGLTSSPVKFTIETTTVVIALHGDSWLRKVSFSGPSGGPSATVSSGTTVELANRTQLARFVSTAMPPGEQGFDSGPLARDERFSFVPTVSGTWEFVDRSSGATGSVTVR